MVGRNGFGPSTPSVSSCRDDGNRGLSFHTLCQKATTGNPTGTAKRSLVVPTPASANPLLRGRIGDRGQKGAHLNQRMSTLWWFLDRLHVLCLKAFRSFRDIELHSLAFLQAAEATSLNRREVHKYVFAILTAD